MEKLDVFDELYHPLDPPSASIDDVHKKGLWHQTFACWVVNPQKRSVLLQLRGPKNRIDPGSLDASAGGHLATGEKHVEGFRELEEELGLSIPAEDRAYLGYFRNIAIRGSYINHEFCHVYLAGSSAAPDTLRLQEGEVSGVFEINIEDAITMFSQTVDNIKSSGVAWNGQTYAAVEKNLTLQDMCNWQERSAAYKYYLKVMQAAHGFVLGEKNLAI